MANDYRDELEAARHRANTLEAQVAEKDAALEAREAELAELRARIERLEASAPPPKSSSRRPWMLAAIPVALGVGAGAAWMLVRAAPGPAPRATVASVVSPGPSLAPPEVTPPPPPPSTPGRTLLWQGTPRKKGDPPKAPQLADVNGDGIEDAIGLVYTPGKDGHVYAGAFSGKDAQPLWLSGELGWLPEGIGDAYVLHAGDVVMAHATSGTLYVLDAATGKVRKKMDPEGDVSELCTGPSGPLARLAGGASQAWVSGSLRATGDVCVSEPTDAPKMANPKADDFKSVSWTRSPKRAFALGSVGRLGQPVALAFDPGSGSVHWRVRTSGSDDAIASTPWTQHVFAYGHDCVYVEVEPAEVVANGTKASGERLLVCLDPATGARKWAAEISQSSVLVSSFVVGKTRLFMARQTRLDVLEVDSGKSVGYVGWH